MSLDRRRKLSSRDYLVIQLASRSHSLSQLGKIFGVDRSWIRRILRKPNLRCPICRKWKPKRQGVVLRSETDAKQFLWVCSACLAIECA
jgi:hypothetical protein